MPSADDAPAMFELPFVSAPVADCVVDVVGALAAAVFSSAEGSRNVPKLTGASRVALSPAFLVFVLSLVLASRSSNSHLLLHHNKQTQKENNFSRTVHDRSSR